jgi:hypothetical protein
MGCGMPRNGSGSVVGSKSRVQSILGPGSESDIYMDVESISGRKKLGFMVSSMVDGILLGDQWGLARVVDGLLDV